MTIKQVADYCGKTFSRYSKKREHEPLGYDPRWDGMTVKDLYFVINCHLLPHQRFSSYEDLVHKINGTGNRTPSDEQKAAATAVLRHRAGQMYNLEEALSAMHRKYLVEVAENCRLERVLSSWGWLAMRNFGVAAVCITLLIGIFRVWGPAFDLFVYRERDQVITAVLNLSRENADLRVYLDDALDNLAESNDRVEALEKKLGIFDGKDEKR